MNAVVQLLKLPWFARIPAWRTWVMPLIWLSLALNATNAIHRLDGPQRLGLAVLASAVAVVWTLVPNALWLTRDTLALRLPHTKRQANECLLLYAVLSVVVPALVLGAIFGHTATWLVSLALVASIVLAVEILPVWFVWVFPLAFGALLLMPINKFHVPLPGDPRYLAWAAPLTIAMGVASVQRWYALHHADLSVLSRWWLPGGQAMRTVRLNSLRGETSTQSIYKRYADAKKPQRTNLSPQIAPAHPVASIRLAIDPLAGPQAQPGSRRSILLGALAVAVFAILLRLNVFPSPARAVIVHLLPLFGILFIGGLVDPFMRSIVARWSRHRAELSLLALLPNLGTPVACKRAALLAGLRPITVWLASTLIATVLIAAALHAPLAIYPLFVLVGACGTALNVATVAHVLARRPPSGLMRFVPKGIIFVLYMVSVMLWQHAFPKGSVMPTTVHQQIFAFAAIAVWAGWLLLLVPVIWRGWRLLKLQPHPFLANPPQ